MFKSGKPKQAPPPFDPAQARTKAKFCWVENISESVFDKMCARGDGPRISYIPGTDVIRISPEDHATWREKLHSKETLERVKREREQRYAHAKRAGKTGAASPNSNWRKEATKKAAKPDGRVKKVPEAAE